MNVSEDCVSEFKHLLMEISGKDVEFMFASSISPNVCGGGFELDVFFVMMEGELNDVTDDEMAIFEMRGS